MEDLFLRVEAAGEGLDGVGSHPERRMVGNADAEILASGWRRGRRRRFEDLGAALGGDGQTRARVKTDGEVDVVAGDEAAAVGEEEEQRDGFWRGWGLERAVAWGWRPFGKPRWAFVGYRWEQFQRVGVGQVRESGRGWWEQGQMNVAFSWDGWC